MMQASLIISLVLIILLDQVHGQQMELVAGHVVGCIVSRRASLLSHSSPFSYSGMEIEHRSRPFHPIHTARPIGPTGG